SVICNTALIAAVTVAVRPGEVRRKDLSLPICFFFVAALFYAGIAYTRGSFCRLEGILLLLIFVIYMVLTVRRMMVLGDGEEKKEDSSPIWKDILLLIVGAALIAAGADLLVDNGTLIAQALGVPESVIALTFVALGTSLPELVTAITSLMKGHGSLSLGNVIGANLFNLVLVSGIAVTLRPFDVPVSSTLFGYNASLVLDIPVMLFVMLFLTIPALVRGKLSRVQGIVLLVVYFSYCVIQFAM
ncbi:MAG: sodium:calcium antiporter, partial [Lachnospiraceae bacterium]|nr:sodium:calcium antiporter [Lachnospiraceae bacterium]